MLPYISVGEKESVVFPFGRGLKPTRGRSQTEGRSAAPFLSATIARLFVEAHKMAKKRDLKLPLLSGRQIVLTLERLGFTETHRKGSHVKMRHSDGRLIVFPYHDEVDRFTLRGALRDADIEVADFLKQIR
jgi:predicted RNA binding protein YcfA (HicA-like mRNA interferase family)